MVSVFILCNIIFASGYLSDGFDDSINLSFSNLLDNQVYVQNQNEVEEIFDLKPKLKSLNFNLVFKGKYELGFEHQYNSSFINAYNLPYRGSYNFLYFKYHLKEKRNFPLNLSFNLKYGEAASFRSDNNFIFNLQTYGFSIYKDFSSFKYPILPILSYQKVNSYINDLAKYDYSIIEISLLFKIVVDNTDNDRRRDIIYLGPKISSFDNDQAIGFIVGLYHPIK